MSTREAAELTGEHQVRRLPAVENEHLIGIASLGDFAVKEAKDSRVGDTLQPIFPRASRSGSRRQQQPECQQGEEQDAEENHHRPLAAPRALEQRPFGGRLYARLGRGATASIADQRLVGDFGAAMCTGHVVHTAGVLASRVRVQKVRFRLFQSAQPAAMASARPRRT